MQHDPDHFELLGLAPGFAVDRDALDRAWREVQARVHPDRHAAGSAQEKRVAMQWASRANEAYRVLRAPLSRARYLCERAGVDLQVETNTAMTPAFLMQQMQWREALEEAASMAELDALDDETQAARGAAIARCGELIDARQDYAGAAREVRALMFIARFAQDIDSRREQLGQ